MSVLKEEQTLNEIGSSVSNFSSKKQPDAKKYSKINYKTRKELIRRVVKQNQKLIPVAKQLGIKLSTSKFIIKSYKKWGRIFKKRSIGDENDNSSSQNIGIQTEAPQIEPFQPQIVYYPYFIYVQHPSCLAPNQQNYFQNPYWTSTQGQSIGFSNRYK